MKKPSCLYCTHLFGNVFVFQVERQWFGPRDALLGPVVKASCGVAVGEKCIQLYHCHLQYAHINQTGTIDRDIVL